MNRFYIPSIILAGLLPLISAAQNDPVNLTELKLSELEQKLNDIDRELKTLASLTLRRDVGSLGYRSSIHKSPDKKEWIRIELGEETVIDAVVLAPVLYREPHAGVEAEGFPQEFRIFAGTGLNTNEVAVVSANEDQTARVAPLTVSFPPLRASWIRIEATALTPRLRGKQYFLQLSEIMVFSGTENVALHKPVTVPTNTPARDGSLEPRFLVDGFTPYILDAAHGAPSKSLLLHVTDNDPLPKLTLDLKSPYPISQINFHSADLSYAIPKQSPSSWAVPRYVRVTGANRPDFSDTRDLCEYRLKTVHDTGPIIMRNFPEIRCRYIGIEIVDHTSVLPFAIDRPVISFSEIEVISDGRNVARHAPISVSPSLKHQQGCLIRITDGVNYYGEILPQREWMNQLSRRHDLKALRPFVETELNLRYAKQKVTLRLLIWLAAALGVGIVISMLVGRMVRMRQKSNMQERFAADLHDELGADLHTIGLLSDLAGETGNDPKELSRLLSQIRTTTEETGEAVRECAHLHTNALKLDLGKTMQQAAERIVVQLEHDFSIEGVEHLAKLKPLVRSDLFLFYKEALINICRHAEASKLSTTLHASAKRIQLTLIDNGHGLPDIASQAVPKSLQRRARLMGAKVAVENVSAGGTCIVLTLATGNRIFSTRKKT
ncbi:histidine kinase [Pontiellaceae bacterium B1224]|nr:histidine kinase [Pontiellaceae bacterium B1224]